MQGRTASGNNRQDLQTLFLAVIAFALSVLLGVGANWIFYSDYTRQRAFREAEDIKRKVFCAELRQKRVKQPDNLYIARDLKRCDINRTRTGK